MKFSAIRVATGLLIALVGVGLGGGLAWLLKPDVGGDDAELPANIQEFQPPSPDLSPAEVVRIQVEALRRLGDDGDAVEQCFALASPANQAVTGPAERFGEMVKMPPYRAMISAREALIGDAVARDRHATVLVTVLDQDNLTQAFRFFLSKQTGDRNADCWMTDAVIPLASSNETQPGDTDQLPAGHDAASPQTRTPPGEELKPHDSTASIAAGDSSAPLRSHP